MAGSSAHLAAIAVRKKTLQIASHLLEVDATDLDIDGEHVFVKGVTSMKITLAQIAKSMEGAPGFALPGNLAPGLQATENVVINPCTYSNGTAVVEVDVDIKTADVKVTRVVFVHDAGRIINPMIAEGQIIGGIAHGIGNALYEWMGYGNDGQPLTTNLADYLLVTATEMPKIELGHHETPTSLNPLGIKGIGELGVIPIPAAIASAIEDALSPFGIRIQQFPIRLDRSRCIAAASRLLISNRARRPTTPRRF